VDVIVGCEEISPSLIVRGSLEFKFVNKNASVFNVTHEEFDL